MCKLTFVSVRLSEEATELEREAIVNALRNFIRDDITQVLDARTLVASTATAISLLQYFFIVVTGRLICIFVLLAVFFILFFEKTFFMQYYFDICFNDN